jgi:hypothetical protein
MQRVVAKVVKAVRMVGMYKATDKPLLQVQVARARLLKMLSGDTPTWQSKRLRRWLEW